MQQKAEQSIPDVPSVRLLKQRPTAGLSPGPALGSPGDPGRVPSHPSARRHWRPLLGKDGLKIPGQSFGGLQWAGGGSGVRRFVSRWQSKGGRHLSRVHLTRKAQPVLDQKVTVLERTPRFLPWLVSAPFAARDIPHPSADNITAAFSQYQHLTLLPMSNSNLLCRSLRHSNQIACLHTAIQTSPLPSAENSHPLAQDRQ